MTIASEEIRIQANLVWILFDSQGNPLNVEAKGSAQFKVGSSNGTAEQLYFSIQSQKIQLAGNASLFWRHPALVVEGKRIEIDLGSGNVVVQEAKLHLKKVKDVRL